MSFAADYPESPRVDRAPFKHLHHKSHVPSGLVVIIMFKKSTHTRSAVSMHMASLTSCSADVSVARYNSLNLFIGDSEIHSIRII